MYPEAFLGGIIDSGLAFLAGFGGPSVSDDARRLMLCIALQESGASLEARYQNSPSTSPGPARGWWQFEQGGGVAGVLQHNASKTLAAEACKRVTVVPQAAAVWRAIEGNDTLSCVFARLLLWTDPRALPTTQADAWDYYIRNWRPGKPHPETWPPNWKTAVDTVGKGFPVS
jgi:hypothetical protein